MRPVIVLTTSPVYEYYISKAVDVVAKPCRLKMSADNTAEILHSVAVSPMFSDAYSVEVSFFEADDLKNKSDFRKALARLCAIDWVRLIIYCGRPKLYLLCTEALRPYDPVLVDSAHLDDFIYEKYIRSFIYKRTGTVIPEKSARLIRKRTRYQSSKLKTYLELLCTVGCTDANIKKWIPTFSGVTVANYPRYLFMGKQLTDVMAVLSKYFRYAEKPRKYMAAFLDTWGQLYVEFLSGRFTERTISEWTAEHGSKFEITTVRAAQDWLTLLSLYSYELFTCYRMAFEELPETEYAFNLYIYRIVRSGVCADAG